MHTCLECLTCLVFLLCIFHSTGRQILLKVLNTIISLGSAAAMERSRRCGNRVSPEARPCVRIATSSSAILIAYGVGVRSVLPPDDVATAGLIENGATGMKRATIHMCVLPS